MRKVAALHAFQSFLSIRATHQFSAPFLNFWHDLPCGTSMAMVHVSPTELQLSCPEEVGNEASNPLMRGRTRRPKGPKGREEQQMSSRILKNFTMLALVVGLALATTLVSANAQSKSVVRADIPFDFIVGNKTLPAGKYMVNSATSDGQALNIRRREGKSLALVLTHEATEQSNKRIARMVFHRYGDQYFLAEVWSGDSYGRQLMESKIERNLRQELASNRPKSGSVTASYEIVEVAALVR
jgi:hypothetical protein